MGYPVVHFEVTGQDGAKLQEYYASLFGWKIDADNEMRYGIVNGADNPTAEGSPPGIGGGVGQGPPGYPGHVTFYVAVPDVEATLAQAEEMGGKRVMGPDEIQEGLVVGLFEDPEGHVIGVLRGQM